MSKPGMETGASAATGASDSNRAAQIAVAVAQTPPQGPRADHAAEPAGTPVGTQDRERLLDEARAEKAESGELKAEMQKTIKLGADVTRCFGGGCADAESCLRYLHHKDDLPMMSYIQGGAFVDGACLYRLPVSSLHLPLREPTIH